MGSSPREPNAQEYRFCSALIGQLALVGGACERVMVSVASFPCNVNKVVLLSTSIYFGGSEWALPPLPYMTALPHAAVFELTLSHGWQARLVAVARKCAQFEFFSFFFPVVVTRGYAWLAGGALMRLGAGLHSVSPPLPFHTALKFVHLGVGVISMGTC